jgi:dihydrofolate reductase
MDENRGIGFENRLPWRLSSDLKRFKSLTMGHFLIMGRKTFQSIGQPLPGRSMIVITRDPHYELEGGMVAHSLEEALELARQAGEQEVFVIGGGEIFHQAYDRADRIYLTQVHTAGTADVFFPALIWEDWKVVETSQHPADERNQFSHTYTVLARKN